MLMLFLYISQTTPTKGKEIGLIRERKQDKMRRNCQYSRVNSTGNPFYSGTAISHYSQTRIRTGRTDPKAKNIIMEDYYMLCLMVRIISETLGYLSISSESQIFLLPTLKKPAGHLQKHEHCMFSSATCSLLLPVLKFIYPGHLLF